MAVIEHSVPYGKRLLPTTIDKIADETPQKLFAAIPRTGDLKDGFMDVSFGDFARAADRIAWWLEELLGKSTTFETLAYLGPSDLRYFIFMIAVPKLGYKLFVPSPRNSPEGQVNLFNKTSCDVLITTPSNKVREYIDERPMRLLYIPELAKLLEPGEVPRYKFPKKFEEAKGDPFLVLHTSGSTSLPKPVFIPHSWVCGVDMMQGLEPHDGHNATFKSFSGKRTFCSLPPFHAAGIIGSLITTVFMNGVSIWHPSNWPLSAPLMEQMLDSIQIDHVFAAPSILEDLTQSPDAVEKLSKLEAVHFGGGPLSRNAGEIISKKVHLRNTIGTTEVAFVPFFQVASENWEYFHSDPELKGLEFQHRGEELYELVIVRHPSTDPYHSAFVTFPELTEYPLNDLFTKHPTKENYWLYVGRADDVVVLSNGEKLTPVAMEASLRDHPSINGALVVGQGRFSTAAVIELWPEVAQTLKSAEEREKFIDSLWPYAASANEKAPAHAQLAKDMIILAPIDKPFLRAGKGTVQRGATVKLFKREIEELYQRTDEEGQEALLDLPKIDLRQDIISLQESLAELIDVVTGIRAVAIDQDFFSSGMDSLHIMRLSKHLKSALVGNTFPQDKINTQIIYTHPTLATLASRLKALSLATNGTTNGTDSAGDREKRMLEMLKKYLDDLPASTTKKARAHQQGLTVILTGSTGSLGSYLLDALAKYPDVTKIYCLNRKVASEQLQTKANTARGLISTWGERIKFLKADLSKPELGLSTEVYGSLLEEASVIIHNQWQVDFNISLMSFEPHVAGVSNLIKLSSASLNSAPIFFTSSIGTVGNWNVNHPNELVPETAIDDLGVAEYQGYSESKWIAEKLLDAAAEKCGVSAAICRVGQIAGPVERGLKGVWNVQEWLPSIIASSKYLGVLPGSLGSMNDVSWTPVDLLSKIIIELILGNRETEKIWTTYYHLDNPKSCKWSSVVPVIQEYFASSDGSSKSIYGKIKAVKLQVVSFEGWVEKLEESAKQKEVDVTKNPGLKLLEFYQGMSGNGAKLDTIKTCRGSETMRTLKAVDNGWMRLWLEQWNF